MPALVAGINAFSRSMQQAKAWMAGTGPAMTKRSGQCRGLLVSDRCGGGNDPGAAMHGKVVVITGATSGIGQIAAERLAAGGARIVLVARDQGRAERTLERLRAAAPGVAHRAEFADLSLLAEVKRVGRDIATAEPRIDVLINNAGNVFPAREVTADGLERTFATNHMAYFVMTLCLRDRLIAAAPARIVNTASAAHMGRALDFDDLQLAKQYSTMTAYGRSKLANILFTRELARRLAGTGVTANCLHPGFVATGLGQRGGGLFALTVRFAMLFGGSAENGAETIVHLASAPDVATVSGKYFIDSRPAEPSAAARDDLAARRLWDESARIAGLA
jgi:NAD(P)-dependent dehydrogenase (short-subunit alcohol dehydrogenase family)